MVTLKFKTITPMHISNGNELAQNLHYVVDGQCLYALDTMKTSSYLAKNKLFNFSRNYSLDDIRAVINSRKEDIASSCSQYAIDLSRDYLEYLGRENRIGQTFVLEFINSNGKFYIPASSIKGALLTILHLESLGITEERANGQVVKPADIRDKFVIHDSDIIGEESLVVYRTGYGRPPINIMCLGSGVEFDMRVPKLGPLTTGALRSKLEEYYPAQILKARDYVRKFKSINNKDAGPNVYEELLNGILDYELDKDEYLINLGFGSGSWFKLFSDEVPPQFRNAKTKQFEEAHTSFILLDQDSIMHLGWCKLKIEE